MESCEVIIVGGGQAGLAMGYHLARRGVRFLVLDAETTIGHSWQARWDSLRLFTPARYSGLPGLAFPGDPDHYPARDEVVAYLQRYARAFDLPVLGGQRVTRLRPLPGAGFELRTATGGAYHARQVVVATGPFQTPALPELATRIAAGTLSIHSSEYRNPEQLPAGDVLVVGSGNSGVQIAEELAASRSVCLAVGETLPRLPLEMLGRSTFWWLERTGVLGVAGDSRLGRRMQARDALFGKSPAMLAREAGVRVVGRIVSADGARLRTAGGESVVPSAVVWATGYRPEHAWIDESLLGPDGRVVQRRGVTPTPGLYFLGLPWMHTRGSALIGWVGRDAEHLAGVVRARDRGSAPATPAFSATAG